MEDNNMIAIYGQINIGGKTEQEFANLFYDFVKENEFGFYGDIELFIKEIKE